MRLTPEDTSDHPGVPRKKRLDMKANDEGRLVRFPSVLKKKGSLPRSYNRWDHSHLREDGIKPDQLCDRAFLCSRIDTRQGIELELGAL